MSDDKKKKEVNDNKTSKTAKASVTKSKRSATNNKVPSVTKRKQSATTNNKVPEHNLIQTNKELGKCGIDHSMLENF